MEEYLGQPLLNERVWRREAKDRRSTCPQCEQDTVDRIRSLGPEQVRSLAILSALWRAEPTGWVHVTSVTALRPSPTEMGGEFARLRYWRFTVAHPDERGFWAPTRRAEEFLRGRLLVPAKIALAEWRKTNKFLGFFAPLVSVAMIMRGANFDLEAVLNSARPSFDGPRP